MGTFSTCTREVLTQAICPRYTDTRVEFVVALTRPPPMALMVRPCPLFLACADGPRVRLGGGLHSVSLTAPLPDLDTVGV